MVILRKTWKIGQYAVVRYEVVESEGVGYFLSQEELYQLWEN